MTKTDRAFEIFASVGYDGSKESKNAILAAIMADLSCDRANANGYFRSCEKKAGQGSTAVSQTKRTEPVDADYNKGLTDEEIAERIEKRFEIMRKMTRGMVTRAELLRSLVIEGAPGIGKTHDIEKILTAAEEKGYLSSFEILSGSASAAGLYLTLWRARNGGIVVLDDCDIWKDEEAMNLIKKSVDTGKRRTMAWRKRSSWIYDVNDRSKAGLNGEADEDDRIPNQFEFKGGVIFITNINLKEVANSGKANAVHCDALMDRANGYIDLTLKTVRDRIIRMKTVWYGGMYQECGLNKSEAFDVWAFVEENQDKFLKLSLRLLKHAADYVQLAKEEAERKNGSVAKTKALDGWKEMLEVTKMKQ